MSDKNICANGRAVWERMGCERMQYAGVWRLVRAWNRQRSVQRTVLSAYEFAQAAAAVAGDTPDEAVEPIQRGVHHHRASEEHAKRVSQAEARLAEIDRCVRISGRCKGRRLGGVDWRAEWSDPDE